MDYKYTEKRRILMQLVSGRYDCYVTHNCKFTVQNGQEICNCNNFHSIVAKLCTTEH